MYIYYIGISPYGLHLALRSLQLLFNATVGLLVMVRLWNTKFTNTIINYYITPPRKFPYLTISSLSWRELKKLKAIKNPENCFPGLIELIAYFIFY